MKILFAVVVLSPRLPPPTVFGRNLTCLTTPHFARISFQCAKQIFNLLSIQFFLTSGIGTDILFINVLENCIEFLTWEA